MDKKLIPKHSMGRRLEDSAIKEIFKSGHSKMVLQEFYIASLIMLQFMDLILRT